MSDELHELASRHLDGALDEAGRARLAARLREPAAQRAYLRLLEQDALLREHATTVLTATARVALPRRRRPPLRLRTWLPLAACLALAAGAVWYATRPGPVAHRDGIAIASGERIAGPATLRLRGGGDAVLGQGAAARIDRDREGPFRLALEAGHLAIDLPPGGPGLSVATDRSMVTVLGTAFAVERGIEATAVSVERGAVRCAADGASADLGPGDIARVDGTGLAVMGPRRDQPARLDDPQRWLAAGRLETTAAPGAMSCAPTAADGQKWIGRSYRWSRPVDTASGAAISARLVASGGGLWHADVFLAPDAATDPDEGQPPRCLRLGVRDGLPVVMRLRAGVEDSDVLWRGEVLAAGAHELRLAVRDGLAQAAIDGRTVWSGACPWPQVLLGVRFARREPGTAPAVLDRIALSPP